MSQYLDARPGELLFAVLGVQLGYLSADDALGVARELAQPGERRSMAELLVARGVLDRAKAQVLERLAARAATAGGGGASETLRLLPSDVRAIAKKGEAVAAPEPAVPADAPVQGLVEEQPHRYFNAPRADAPPEVLGRGQHGSVVLMHDTVLGRDVAWKEAASPTPEGFARLLAGARQAARLDHPAAVPIYELGRGADGAPYVTMRRVAGETLAEAITRATSINERLALLPALYTVARCVAVAHQQKVTHRSLGCDAVRLGTFGEVYLLGWGPPLESPEAEAADVKALGAMLHEVVTGLPPPVMGELPMADFPPDLRTLVREALAGRVASADRFAAEVQAFIDGRRVAVHDYSSWQLVQRALARNRVVALVTALAAVLVAGLWAWGTLRIAEERDRSRLFARRFVDDIALRLEARPGVEPLIEQVTRAALAHYRRTGELGRLPPEERMRVALAMARLGAVSVALGHAPEAQESLDFASALATELLREAPGRADAQLVLARVELSRAQVETAPEAQRAASAARARQAADVALALQPDAAESRALAAQARVTEAATARGAAQAATLLDDALRLVDGNGPAEDPVLRARAEVKWARLEARWGTLSREQRAHEADALVKLLGQLRRAHPDDVQLQLRLAQGLLFQARALEPNALVQAQGAAREALALARGVWQRRPDFLGLPAVLVEAELRAGRPAAALASARRWESVGGKPVQALMAEAALLGGDLELARALAGRAEAAGGPGQVLVRAVSSALLERPGDAVIQVRALRGQLGETGWPPERLVRLLEARPPTGGAGRASTEAFARAWQAGDPGALDAWVAALEAQLAGR
jgi:hypothetical protein